MARNAIYIGVRGSVLALDPSTGAQLWQTELTGSGFVNIVLQGKLILATTKGEIFALDPASGATVWHNKLTGFGLGFVTIAGASQAPVGAAIDASQQNDAALAAGTAAATSG